MVTRPGDESILEIARTILAGFDKHHRLFRAISAGAKERFERGDWAAVRAANRARIGMYDQRVREGVAAVLEYPEARDERHWPAIKQVYVTLLLEHQQPELAETFFNSVAARVLDRTYYNNAHIFWRPAVSTEHIESLSKTYRVYYPAELGLRGTLRAIVMDLHLMCPWEDLERDLHALVHGINELIPKPREMTPSLQVHVLSSLFYRNRSAYLVGRLNTGTAVLPFAVPVQKNGKGELYLDALLGGKLRMGTLFSLARAYFMVNMHNRQGGWLADEHQGQGLHRGHTNIRRGRRRINLAGAAACGVRQGRARRRRPHARTTSTATSAPATRPASARSSMVDYMGLKVRHVDSTDTGGSSYLLHVGHAAEAIAAGQVQGRADHAGRPAALRGHGDRHRAAHAATPHASPMCRSSSPTRPTVVNMYAMCRAAPHARVRHHQRAARLDQGRGLAPRAAQPARHAARRRHGRGGGRTRR